MHPSYIINSHEDQKTSSCSNINYNPVVLEKKCLTGKIKKDRHSKINTARGPRDRRMRLSLDVAKKFFGLQDMLGFDKASNTIEWLMMNSKQAIQDLWSQQLSNIIGVSNSPSSASECEVLSDHQHNMILIKKETHNFNSCSSNKEHKKVQRVRKGLYFNQSLAKETRDKARARARKRTSEKKNIKLIGYDYDVAAGCHQYSKLRPSLDQIMDHNMNRFGSWIPFGENQVQLTDQITEYPSSHSSMMSSNLSPSFLFNYQHNPAFYNEHQFSDLQMLDKPIWEGLNN
ncbi:hypothetical protein QVD17_25267 [Tagetes erecta]|uniref:Uncharacterized protein n=1 Tax=Tagetes erecta TaxID=13708 RepID=A0AAD8KIU0_TARER|nr:hypothetical protein QVD17_25267 [Tagetes erecta]